MFFVKKYISWRSEMSIMGVILTLTPVDVSVKDQSKNYNNLRGGLCESLVEQAFCLSQYLR